MDFIYSLPTWILTLSLLASMTFANAFGYWLGTRRKQPENDRAHGVNSALKASVLGLVALLLGFTYSMSSNRHSTRQQIVLDEANSIGTCYLRAGLLHSPSGEHIRQSLRRYVDLRLNLFTTGRSDHAMGEISPQLEAERNTLWAAVEESFRLQPDLTYHSDIIPAANDVIDQSGKRIWAMHNHVPKPIFLLLASCLIIAGALIGHSSGEVRRPAFVLWTAQNLLITLVVFVVIDLDRPAQGLIQVDHQPLIDLRNSINN